MVIHEIYTGRHAVDQQSANSLLSCSPQPVLINHCSPSLFIFCSLIFFGSFLLLCFHLDWSVKHAVSLLSNHFKNTRAHIHTHAHVWCPNLLLCMTEWVSFDAPKLFFPQRQPLSHAPHLIDFTSGPSSRHLGQPPPPPARFAKKQQNKTKQKTDCHTSWWHLVPSWIRLSLMYTLHTSCHYSKGALSFAASYLDTSN